MARRSLFNTLFMPRSAYRKPPPGSRMDRINKWIMGTPRKRR